MVLLQMPYATVARKLNTGKRMINRILVFILHLVYFVLVTGEIFPNQPAADRQHWLLDPEIAFLNHGAFGACPRRVLECQSEWRARMERQPLQFLVRELETHLDAARKCLAQFADADTDDLVFVPNATTGLNAVLRSLEFRPGDELVVTDQEYNASAMPLISSQSVPGRGWSSPSCRFHFATQMN